MESPFEIEAVLDCIRQVTKEEDQDTPNAAVPVSDTFVPDSHARALDPDISLVVGIRGAGKSYWWRALLDDSHREKLIANNPELRKISGVKIFKGFGQGFADSFPSAETINSLREKKYDSKHIWRAVVGYNLGLPAPFPQFSGVGNNWSNLVDWIAQNNEQYECLMREMDNQLVTAGQRALILFDALDRLADGWNDIRPIAKHLFMVALELRSFRNIRAKLFVRPDMLEDAEIRSFPDASKLIAKQLGLIWTRADLYSMLFQRMANVDVFGNTFREISSAVCSLKWELNDSVWTLSKISRGDEDALKTLLHSITGPFMAKGESGHKRGLPYTWLVNHLIDGQGQVSPRSFLAALRNASSSDKDDPTWPYALNPHKIQAGVSGASRIRKSEIIEDYPWVEYLLNPMRDRRLVVPCEEKEIVDIWNENEPWPNLAKKNLNASAVKLPPRHIEEGPRAVLGELIKLGIFQRLPNNKIQMPDVYRIAFGLGRKGGVKPLR